MLRAWRGRDGCRDPGRPWAWLAQITRNEALRAAARRPPEAGGDDALPEPACPVSPGVVVEERLDLDAALAGLPALDRVLVGLYYECDLSVSAVADLAGLSPGAVKVRLHRARAALRSVLEPDNRC